VEENQEEKAKENLSILKPWHKGKTDWDVANAGGENKKKATSDKERSTQKDEWGKGREKTGGTRGWAPLKGNSQ